MSQQLAKINIGSTRVGDCNIATVTSARNLGSSFDSKAFNESLKVS